MTKIENIKKWQKEQSEKIIQKIKSKQDTILTDVCINPDLPKNDIAYFKND